MRENKYVIIADEHAGYNGRSGPYYFCGRTAIPVTQVAINYAERIGATAIFSLGDMIAYERNSNCAKDVARARDFYNRTYGQTKIPVMVVDGNQQLGCASSEDFNGIFGRPASSYFRDFGNERVVVLNPRSEQQASSRWRYVYETDFLKTALQSAGGKKIHVISHFGAHCSDTVERKFDLVHRSREMRDIFDCHAARTGVHTTLWSGHRHYLTRYVQDDDDAQGDNDNNNEYYHLPSISVNYLEESGPTGFFAVAHSGPEGVYVEFKRAVMEQAPGSTRYHPARRPVQEIDLLTPFVKPQYLKNGHGNLDL